MIDIIIATYNRPAVICKLVEDIVCKSIPELNKIIIVDSSDDINENVKRLKQVKYIHSNHKNQPYQRYLGFHIAESPYLLYLDDDMQLLDTEVFQKIENIFSNPDVVGINLLFTNKNDFINNIAKHSYNKIPSFIRKSLHWFSANPELPAGKYWYCGCRGKRIDDEYSEYFSGGAFCARRKYLYKNFDLNLFTLFEKRIGMGEDMILAYTLSKQGKIYNMPNSYFFHNDTGTSTYAANNKAYNYRVAYSRMYLSLQYARLNGESCYKAAFITMWYHLWRILGLLFIATTNKKVKFSGLVGYVRGAVKSLDLLKSKNQDSYWKHEIIENNK